MLQTEDRASTGVAASASYAGLIAVLAAITMLFSAFSSAYIVRRGLASDWHPLELPRIVWMSVVAVILSAAMLMWGQRLVAIITGLIAGLIVVESWRELATGGVAISTNAAAAFFFLFSGAFLLCLLAGLIALLRSGSRHTGLYWRYLGALWIWLLVMFEVWR